MARQILRRCDVCKHFHVSYVVEDAEFGIRHLCTTCWKALYGDSSHAGTKEEKSEQSRPAENDNQS